jgi:hypothetical protein
MLRGLLACGFGLWCSACMLHQSSSQRLLEAANELNLAARFGQLDTALQHTSSTSRATFMQRREAWGSEVRVVDVNLASVNLKDENHADVIVQYLWTRMDEGVLRNTAVRQQWENPEFGGWRLEREQRSSGDLGLFGETIPQAPGGAPRDVHFPTRSLGTGAE